MKKPTSETTDPIPKLNIDPELKPEELRGWFFCWVKPLGEYSHEKPVLRFLRDGKTYVAEPTKTCYPEHVMFVGLVAQYERFQPVVFPS